MGFDASEATVESIHRALFSGNATCRQVVQAFLSRIESHNEKINAVICLNENALREADLLDEQLASGDGDRGLLWGIPILLKDNFDAMGLPTTAGCLALKDCWPQKDADVVVALREAGAIILGKTNLHELALDGLTVSSLGGQTLNPYDFTRTPGGSSGGSGAAVAASFAVMATGSDTVNSLRSPASANSLYSFRPTQGLISGTGIVPVSSTQDTIGMIARSLSDLAISLTVMASAKRSEAEYNRSNVFLAGTNQMDYVMPQIKKESTPLRQFRIGILHGYIHTKVLLENEPVKEAMGRVRSLLQTEGAVVVDIDENSFPDADTIRLTMDVQMYEIRKLMDSYLASSKSKGTHPTSFADIFLRQSTLQPNTNPQFLIAPAQYSYLHTALNCDTESPEYATRKQLISELTSIVSDLFERYALDALIYPQQRSLVVPVGTRTQHGRNGILAAVTGSPVVCIPIGFSQPTNSAPIGVPIGMELLGKPWTEAKLFEIAQALDVKLKARRTPVTGGLAERVDTKEYYEKVPLVVPGGLSSVNVNAYAPGITQIE